jgi:hypothetical protein
MEEKIKYNEKRSNGKTIKISRRVELIISP